MPRDFEYSILHVEREIPKGNRGEVIRIALIDYGGGPRMDIRVWFPDKETGELRMGKGISIHPDDMEEVADGVYTINDMYQEGAIG